MDFHGTSGYRADILWNLLGGFAHYFNRLYHCILMKYTFQKNVFGNLLQFRCDKDNLFLNIKEIDSCVPVYPTVSAGITSGSSKIRKYGFMPLRETRSTVRPKRFFQRGNKFHAGEHPGPASVPECGE
jgi:hypothetical protein